MALIKCPECGKEVSDKATKCIHCGNPFNVSINTFEAKAPPVQAKKNRTVVKILVWIFVAFVLLAVIITLLSPKDDSPASIPSQNETSATPTSVSPSPSPTIEYIEITATELIIAYDENEIAADNKYKNQMLKVSGTVGSIGKDILLDTPYVTLKYEGEGYIFSSAQFFFDKNNTDDIAELREGDTVMIIGKCDGLTFNVILRKCDVIE